LAWSYLKI